MKLLKKLAPGPRTEELQDFYDIEYRIVELNTAVLEGVLAHPSASKVLSTGRIIILSDAVSSSSRYRFDGTLTMLIQHFKDSPAVLLKSASFAVNAEGVIEDTKRFYVLAFVPPEIRSGARSTISLSSIYSWLNFGFIDISADSVPPRWPPSLENLDHSQLTYELAIIPITSISLVTKYIIKVSSISI